MKLRKRRCNYNRRQRRKNTGRKKGLHAKKINALRRMKKTKH